MGPDLGGYATTDQEVPVAIMIAITEVRPTDLYRRVPADQAGGMFHSLRVDLGISAATDEMDGKGDPVGFLDETKAGAKSKPLGVECGRQASQ